MKALILVDEKKVGTRKQAEALCHAMELPYDVREIPCSWKGFILPRSTMLKMLNLQGFSQNHYHFVVSAGRRSAIWGLRLKRFFSLSKTIHIMNPGFLLRSFFDYVIVPSHDNVKGRNIIETLGALVKVEPPSEEAIKTYKNHVSYQKKTLVLAIGGPTKAYFYTPEIIQNLMHSLDKILSKEPMNVLITFSRRTDLATKSSILQWASKIPDVFVWNESGPNPYNFFLERGDFFVVTQDSISMICDICFTGRPIYVAKLQGKHRRFEGFFQEMASSGRMRWFNGELESWSYEPLQEVYRVANTIKSSYKQSFLLEKNL